MLVPQREKRGWRLQLIMYIMPQPWHVYELVSKPAVHTLCSLQPANSVFLSHQTSTSHQPALFFSHSKSAPATGHSQPNRKYSLWYIYCIAISCKQTTPVIKKTKKWQNCMMTTHCCRVCLRLIAPNCKMLQWLNEWRGFGGKNERICTVFDSSRSGNAAKLRIHCCGGFDVWQPSSA